MKINWSKTIKNSILFGINPKIWLPYLLLDVFCLSAIFITIFYNTPQILMALGTQSTSELINYLWPSFLIFIIWMLLRLWIDGAVIYQSFKPKDFVKSWNYSFKKYPSIFAAAAIIFIITLVLNFIPYIGWLIGIITSLILFFVMQAIIVDNKGYYEGLSESYKIFKKNWHFVLVMYIITILIVICTIFVFSIPFILILANMFTSGLAETISMLLLFKEQLPMVVIPGIIMFIGFSISRAFSLKLQTDFYLQIKRKIRF